MAETRITPADTATVAVAAEDLKLKRSLGSVHLAAMTFSGMMGSGWLFAAYYGALGAGPAALISWCIGGVFTAVTALVFIELAIGYPISGGGLRWPQLAAGPFVGALAGWVTFGLIVIGGSSESAGIFQYASRWWPALFDAQTGQLTWTGIGMCCVAIATFTVINFMVIRFVSFINVVLSIAKWVIPFMTIGLLLAAGFHGSNFTSAGGFAPYGTSAVLSVVTTGGIVYAFGGMNIAQTVAGEVKDPRRSQTRGTTFGILSAVAVYLLLQLTFIGAIPIGLLAKVGWHGLSFSSPFAQLAVLLNLGWLSTVLVIDAVLSPSAASLIGTTSLGRMVYGMAQNRTLPRYFRAVTRQGVPMRALIFYSVFSILSLVLLRSWHNIVAVTGAFFAFGYASASVALGVLLHVYKDRWKTWCPGIRFISYANFVLAATITYWDGWDNNRYALGFLAAFIVVWYLLRRVDPGHHTFESVRLGVWLFAWLAITFALSYVGATVYQGRGWIGQPWDTILVAVVALAAYPLGIRCGADWVRAHGLRGTPLPESEEPAVADGQPPGIRPELSP